MLVYGDPLIFLPYEETESKCGDSGNARKQANENWRRPKRKNSNSESRDRSFQSESVSLLHLKFASFLRASPNLLKTHFFLNPLLAASIDIIEPPESGGIL